MPTTDAIIWTGISGLILIMLGIIGHLLNTGFSSMREEVTRQFKTLWEKLDRHQQQAETNAIEIAAINARCTERYNSCKREP